MKIQKNFITNISIAIIVATACIRLSGTAFFQNLEFHGSDLLFRLRGAPAGSSKAVNIVIVEITDDDIRAIGRWPWPRTRVVEMCSILKDLGPKQIYFDFLFSAHTVPQEDNQVAQVFKEMGNVYIPFVLRVPEIGRDNIIFPMPKLLRAVRGTGAAIILPDMDGKWRKVPLFFYLNGQRYDHIVLQMVKDGLGAEIKTMTPDGLVLANKKEEFSIPLVQGNKMLLNWLGPWTETFKRYSYLDFYRAYQDVKKQRPPRVDRASFKNSICLVGVTAVGYYDNKPNPFELRYPGIGVVATALDNIYNRQFFQLLPIWVNLLFVYFFALVPPFYISGERFARGILLILFLAAAFLGIYFLFLKGFIMNFSLPFIALVGSYIMVSMYNSASLAIEKKNLFALATMDGLTGIYNVRYFKEILQDECLAAQKDSNRQFCLVICDIDHYKQFNDRYGHLVGDFVLESIARTLKNSVRTEDVVGRYGGDEMVILLRRVSIENACLVAEKIRDRIEHLELEQAGQSYKVTVSLGVACINALKDSPVTIIKKADDALYSAKKNGRNRVCHA